MTDLVDRLRELATAQALLHAEACAEITRLRQCLAVATALLDEATPLVWIRAGDSAAAHAWKAKVADLLLPDLP